MGTDVLRRVAYFSMEVAVDSRMPTYSGGLGVLAGDTLKSCADLRVPAVAVSLMYKNGYLDQRLDEWGNQRESPVVWQPSEFAHLLPASVTQGRCDHRLPRELRHGVRSGGVRCALRCRTDERRSATTRGRSAALSLQVPTGRIVSPET